MRRSTLTQHLDREDTGEEHIGVFEKDLSVGLAGGIARGLIQKASAATQRSRRRRCQAQTITHKMLGTANTRILQRRSRATCQPLSEPRQGGRAGGERPRDHAAGDACRLALDIWQWRAKAERPAVGVPQLAVHLSLVRVGNEVEDEQNGDEDLRHAACLVSSSIAYLPVRQH